MYDTSSLSTVPLLVRSLSFHSIIGSIPPGNEQYLNPQFLLVVVVIENKRGRPSPFATYDMFGREDKITNNKTMFPGLKNNAAAGYKGPVKIKLLKGAGQLPWYPCDKCKSDLKVRVGCKRKQIP